VRGLRVDHGHCIAQRTDFVSGIIVNCDIKLVFKSQDNVDQSRRIHAEILKNASARGRRLKCGSILRERGDNFDYLFESLILTHSDFPFS